MSTRTPRAPRWVTLLPIVICVILNGVGILLARMQWAAARAGVDGPARPDELAAAVPQEAVAFVGIQLVSAALLVLSGWVSAQEREVSVLATGVVVMLAIFQWGGLVTQRNQDDVAIDVALAMFIGLVVAVCSALAVLAAIRLPVRPALDLGQAAFVVLPPWSGHTRVSTLVAILPALALVPLTVLVLWALAVIGPGVALLIALALVAMVLVQLALRVQVLVDQHGVTARWPGAFTWMRLPLASIEVAYPVSEIDPIGDFGGWGLRAGFDGSRGLVTAAGAGVRINQLSGQAVVITVEHPTEAAAAINGLVWRRDAAADPDRR